MTIIQGDNHPITITFQEDMTDILKLSVGLYENNGYLTKHWSKDDVTIDGTEITCPLTEAETSVFNAGLARLCVKWDDEDGDYRFAKDILVNIIGRKDKVVKFSG